MPNPYDYYFVESLNIYKFITKNAIEYRIAFVVDETFSTFAGIPIENVYQIIIEKFTDNIEGFDSSVSLTIINIVKKFFENSENSMIYICDDSDKKAISRFNTFERWYKNSEMTDYISKVDNIIKCNPANEIYTIYTSLLFHKNNFNRETILKVYSTIEEILNSEK